MPEKINIASLTIDFDDVIKKSADYKKTIDQLKAAQKDYDKTTEKGRQQLAKNEAQVKNLSKALRDNQSFASALDAANKDLEKTLSSENKSTQELRDSRSQLNQISKNIVGDTEEEVSLRNKLNKAIDEQTQKIREQGSSFNASKDQIGEYKDNIIEANRALKQQEATLKGVQEELEKNIALTEEGSEEYKELSSALAVVNKDLDGVTDSLEEQNDEFNLSNLSVGGFIEQAQDTGGAGKLIAGGAKAAAKGLLSLTKAAIGFILTPVGLIILALAGAFLLIKNAMNRSEDATNRIRKAFSAFSGIINGLLKVLEPLGDFLIDGIVNTLELVEKGMFKAMEAIARGLKFLGFDKAAEQMRNFNSEIKASVEASKNLVEAQIKLEKAQRIARKIQLDFQKGAEKLRQIRDDESKSIQERIKANDDLGDSLKKQSEVELDIANKALEVADLRIIAEGETTSALDARAEALTEIADIQERISGQESEQIVNRVSLEKEANEQAKKIAEDQIKRLNEQLDLFIKQQGIKAKTLEEGLEFEKQIADKKLKILEDELKNKTISIEKYNAEVLDIQNNLLQKQAELTVDNFSRELEAYIKNNESKLESDKFLSERAVEEERKRLELIAEKRKEFERKRFEEGVISQTEFNDAINQINEEDRISNEELEAERKQAKAEQEAIDFENKRALEAEQTMNGFAIFQQQLEDERATEIANAKKTGADVGLINKKFDASEKNLAKDLADFKADQNSNVLNGFKGLFGEASDLGKAFSVAEIINSTVKNASQAFQQAAVFASNPLTLPLAANANIQGGIIVATGAAQIAKTTGIKFGEGAILEGRSHSQGGIDFLLNGKAGFNAEGGEALINKRSTSMFAPLLSAINVAGGGKKFASGTILGSSSIPSAFIDYDILASKISEANESLPNPVVSVEEINEVNTNVAVVENDALFGS